MRFASKIALVVLAVTLIASCASATVINGDLDCFASGSTNYPDYSGQGAYSDPGNNYWTYMEQTFNGAATYSSLLDSTGLVNTGVTFATGSTLSAQPNGGNGGGGEVPLNLLGNFIASSNGTFTFSGLPANTSGYSLYLYAVAIYSSLDLGCQFTVNGSPSQTSSGTVNNSWVLGADYVVFTNITTSATGTITGTFASTAAKPTYEGYFNGFQLITPSGASSPEPGTLALLAAGLAGLLCYAWRKRR